ncbi:MAG: hypothetical protein ABI665_18560 [Vicinamibacterales bacterium]
MGFMKAVMAGALVIGCSAALLAIERTTLPVFDVSDARGATVSSRTLVRAGTWLLVYVRPDCPPCDAILRSVDKDRDPALPSRIVVMVALSDSRLLPSIAERFPALAGAAWYADSSAGAQAMRVTDVPAVLGVRDATIEWSVGGVLTDAADITTIMAAWVKR